MSTYGERQEGAQAILTKGVKHLRAQGCRAMSTSRAGAFYGCAYRGFNDTKCAAGVFIPDEAYSPNMEGCAIDSVLRKHCNAPWAQALVPYVWLLRALQEIHDNIDPSCWEDSFRTLTERFDLTIPGAA